MQVLQVPLNDLPHLRARIVAQLPKNVRGMVHSFNSVVVDDPDHNDRERQQMKSCVEAAGFRVLRIIQAATAAAIAHYQPLYAEAYPSAIRTLVLHIGNRSAWCGLLSIDDCVYETCRYQRLPDFQLDVTVARHLVYVQVAGVLSAHCSSFPRPLIAWMVEYCIALDEADAPLAAAVEQAKTVFSSAQAVQAEIAAANVNRGDLWRAKDTQRIVELVNNITSADAAHIHYALLSTESRCFQPEMKRCLQRAAPDAVLLEQLPPERAICLGAHLQAQILCGHLKAQREQVV